MKKLLVAAQYEKTVSVPAFSPPNYLLNSAKSKAIKPQKS
jgi:hypothetical protein